MGSGFRHCRSPVARFPELRPDQPVPGRLRPLCVHGHGSMLIYSLLHLTEAAPADVRTAEFPSATFKTPSPEVGYTAAGVETYYWPGLSQGGCQRRRMAIAEKTWRRSSLTVPPLPLSRTTLTYVFMGDGCMTGISRSALLWLVPETGQTDRVLYDDK